MNLSIYENSSHIIIIDNDSTRIAPVVINKNTIPMTYLSQFKDNIRSNNPYKVSEALAYYRDCAKIDFDYHLYEVEMLNNRIKKEQNYKVEEIEEDS